MQIQRIEISKLTGDPANARKHGERNIQTIVESLSRFGQQKPIVVDSSNCVRAGNGTLEAARSLGWTHLDCVVTDLKGSDAIAYAIADNRTSELAEWDDSVLVATLEGLQLEGLLDSAGFSDDELSDLMKDIELDGDGTTGEIVEDEVPEIPDDPITKPGDLWILGRHRLLCGDSTKAEDVARLMDGEKADLCFTSPPYALGKSVALSGNKTMAKKGNAYGDYTDSTDEWESLMRRWFEESKNAVEKVWVINVQPLAGNKRQMMRFIADNVSKLADIVTWDKGHAQPAMASAVMDSRFEWMLVFSSEVDATRAIPLATWRGTVQNVYTSAPQRSNEFSKVHAATMPVHVPSWVMQTLCNKSTDVYEPFCGTGTTLIAAEQLGRKCYGMEISPQYCDVIVKRWENLTGQKAVLHGDSGNTNGGEGVDATVADQTGVSGSDHKKVGASGSKPAKQRKGSSISG